MVAFPLLKLGDSRPALGDVFLLLDYVEGNGAVQLSHVELGELLLGAAGLLLDDGGVGGEPGRINLHPADVVAVDVMDLGPYVGGSGVAHRRGDDVGEVLLKPVPRVLVAWTGWRSRCRARGWCRRRPRRSSACRPLVRS